MAKRPQTAAKREREHAKLEKRRRKEERRAAAAAARSEQPPTSTDLSTELDGGAEPPESDEARSGY